MLLKLYVEHVNDNPQRRFSYADIKGLFTIEVSQNLIATAVDELYGKPYQNERLITKNGTANKGDLGFRISSAGIQLVERTLRDKTSDMSYLLEHGDVGLDDVAGFHGIFWNRSELADLPDWMPLQLEEGDVDEVGDSVEKALEAIESNNELAEKFPEERIGLIETVRLGLERLRSKAPTRSQLSDLLVKPLKWVAAQFASGFLGDVCKIAAQRPHHEESLLAPRRRPCSAACCGMPKPAPADG